MNVELRHLRALAAIGDEGTITDAADALHLTQPALSRTLAQLESRTGRRLVARTTRRLELTEAGRRLHEHAHRILHQLEDALAEAAAEPRPLRIGFAGAVLGERTVPLMRGWRTERPDTPLRVHRCDNPEEALRRGEIDAAVLRAAPESGSELMQRPLYRERRVAAVPEDDPLADRPSVRLAEVANRSVVLCSTAATTDGLWSAGQQLRTFEVANADEWLTVIASGEAVGVTTEATAHSRPHPGVRFPPLADAGSVVVRLVWSRAASHPATVAFADYARRAGATAKQES